MVSAGETIKYCSVGHSVCHIYFASSIETLEDRGRKIMKRSKAQLSVGEGRGGGGGSQLLINAT